MTTAHSSTIADPLFASVPLFWHLLPGGTREILIVVAAMAAISLGVLGWAVFVRKPGRRHHHPRHHRQHRPEPPSDPGAPEPERRGKWRRRRRRDHRPRNPTLAETGGLPPARPGPPADSGL